MVENGYMHVFERTLDFRLKHGVSLAHKQELCLSQILIKINTHFNMIKSSPFFFSFLFVVVVRNTATESIT